MSLVARYSFITRRRGQPGPRTAHAHTFEVNLVEAGREHVWLESTGNLEHGAGAVAVIPATVEHASWTRQHDVAFHNVHLHRDAMAEHAEALHLNERSWRNVAFPSSRALHAVMQGFRAEYAVPGQPLGRELVTDALALQLIALLARRQNDPPRTLKVAPAPRAGIDRVEQCLRENPERNHRLSDLAALAGCSAFHLVRTFKKRFGVSPVRYLGQLRLERARALVLGSELSLTVIAADLGFGSSSRLSEGFKRRFGVTPSSLRR